MTSKTMNLRMVEKRSLPKRRVRPWTYPKGHVFNTPDGRIGLAENWFVRGRHVGCPKFVALDDISPRAAVFHLKAIADGYPARETMAGHIANP